MVRKIIAAAIFSALLGCAPALAQSQQLGPGQVLGNSTAAQRPARPENISAIFDKALGSTRGSILERGSSGWAPATPGTTGFPWVSAGAGADPAYSVLGIVGGGTGSGTASGARTNLGVTATGADTTYNYRANNLNDVASASAARTNLGLAIGTNVEAWDNDLDCLASLATTGLIHRTGTGTCSAGTAALADLVTGTQDTVLGYYGSTTASAATMPNCTGALNYSTSTHTFSCNSSAGTGTVTSISITAGTGITQSGSPVTTSGTITVNVDKAASADLEAGTASKVLTADNIFDAEKTITYAASQTFDFSTFLNGRVTLTGNITSLTCSNMKASQGGVISLVQDGTGSRTMVAGWCSQFRWTGGVRGVLSTAPSAIDALFYQCVSTSICYVSLGKAQAN